MIFVSCATFKNQKTSITFKVLEVFIVSKCGDNYELLSVSALISVDFVSPSNGLVSFFK